MSSQLDPSILAEITAEARECFLDEDAPEYLQMLEQGIKSGRHSDFTYLLRAAHSLKGGAGLACLDSLQELAHKLEDVLIAVQRGQIPEVDFAWSLVERSVDEVALLLAQARTTDEVIADRELVEALTALTPSAASEETPAISDSSDNGDNSFVSNTLTEDLEASLAAIEELTEDLPLSLIQQSLTSFADECLFLGETLNLPWLQAAATSLESALEAESPAEILGSAQAVVADLRSQREAYLNGSLENESLEDQAEISSDDNEFVVNTLNQDLEQSLVAIEQLTIDSPNIMQQLLAFADECAFLGETLNLPWLVEATAPIESIVAESSLEKALLSVQEIVGQIRTGRNLYLQKSQESEPTAEFTSEDDPVSTIPALEELATASIPSAKSLSNLRIPLHKIEGMTNNVEELILTQARLGRQQQLLNQANRRLRELTKQFEPIRDQVQNLYDRLAVGSTNMISNKSVSGPNTNGDQSEFDSLELDRYTELHSSLQSFQELMLRVQETRTDLEFVNRELVEDLEQTQKNLDSLYANVTESRLVPFHFLAKRFIPQIRSLNGRFNKSVELKIAGENTLIDQVLLEQLQTPLTHLLNNAFDHGIESPAERLANQKAATAVIRLEAQIKNNQLVITIQDDGCGINLQKVYQRAVTRGICPADKSIEQFTPEEIIDWIFEPDFSTASQVSDISGRGMGLDIVRSQIRKLRGNVGVETQPQQGTTFTLRLPLNLSLMSLLLIRLQNRIIAIPNTSIVETLPYRELNFTDSKTSVQWQQQSLPVVSVSQLLPCPRKPIEINQARVGIVIEAAFGRLMVLVDGLIAEEKLIVKPFDDTVPVPPYVAGCTVLGTGEVIPVILPLGFEQSTLTAASDKPTAKNTITNVVPTILVAEDSVATRRMLEKVLTAVGYQVIVCRDGQEALDNLKQHQGTINLIISDVEMPKVNGFELLQQVRSNPAYHNTPVVMATSRTGDRHRQQAMKLGATDYLGKPVQPQELLTKVEGLLAG